MKKFNYILHGLIVIVLVCAAYLSGIYSTKFKQNKEENKNTVTTIAVVNADNGVIVEGEKVNYATELITFPDTNFETVGLTEAREGVTTGRYAAYILIPSDFSVSIESVNEKPAKSQITYELNSNLRQDAQMKVINDIHNFILNLSTNVSYMYVDAILKEMHAVQNDSDSIMENDVADMKAITDVQNTDLIEEVVFEPLETVETEFTYLDLTDNYEKVSKAIEDINSTYENDIGNAEKELLTVKDVGETVNQQASVLTKTLGNVNIRINEENICVYESGMQNLTDLAATFEQDAIQKKKTAKERLGFKEGDIDPEPEIILPGEPERYYISKDDLIQKIDIQIDYMENIKKALFETPEISINEESTEEEERKIEINVTEEEFDFAISQLEDLKSNIDSYYTNAIRAINEIPTPSGMVESANTIITEEIEKPLLEEIDKEEEKINGKISSLQVSIKSYATTLDECDPIACIEKEKINEYLGSLNTTIGNMETEVMEQDAAYLEYVNDVVVTSDNNLQMLQSTIDTAYEKTQSNIDNTMQGFKQNRTEINAQNILLLDGITQKLPYTRLGNLEYTQVYDFIVQPVITQDNSIVKTEITDTSVNVDREDLIGIFIGITALIIIDIVVQLIHRKITQKKENGEEEEHGSWNTNAI